MTIYIPSGNSDVVTTNVMNKQLTSYVTNSLLTSLLSGLPTTGTTDVDALMFSGTSVPITSEGFDVFLVFGQSNSVGYPDTGIDALLDDTDPRIKQLGQLTGYNNLVMLAQDPLQHNPGNAGKIGFSMTFAKRYLRSLPSTASKRIVLLLPSGVGATGFNDGRWGVGNDLYNNALNRAVYAMSLGPVPAYNRFCGFLWHQGESDALAVWSQSQYSAALDALITGMRAGIPGGSTAPFICGLFLPSWAAANSALATPIQAALLDTPNRKTKCGVVDSSGLIGGDTIHFNAASLRILGNRYFEKFASIVAVPSPVFIVSTTAVSGSSISLTWIQKPVSNVTYKFYQALGSGSFSLIGSVIDTNTSTISGLIASTLYRYKIVASSTAGDSADSNIVSVTTTTLSIPSQITGMTSTSITLTSISFSWSPPMNAYNYEIFQNGISIATQSGLTKTVTGLTSGTSYSFTVRAVNPLGNGSLSTALVMSTGSLPSQVTPGPVCTSSSSSVSLTFTSSTGATSYDVYYALAGGTLALYSNVSGLSATVTGLLSSTAYIFAIQSRNAFGVGTISSNTTTTTGTGTAPPIWKLDFNTGAAVLSTNSTGTTIVPTTVNTGASVVSYEVNAPRGMVMKRANNSPESDSKITLTNSALPLSYTKTFWVKLTSTSGAQSVTCSAVTTSTYQHYTYMNSGRFTVGQGPSNTFNATAITANTWVFCAVSFDNSTGLATMYQDGSVVQTATIATWLGPGDVCQIGTYATASLGMSGWVDKPSVYNGVLTSAQIIDIYNAEFL